MMENWAEGYVTDIDYTYSFFEELDPAWIIFALAQKGFVPPNYDQFNYCELGFGQGFGTNHFAAINPQGEFWGTDFNPSHASHGRLLASKAERNNVHLFDKSFAEFLDTETPQFDFIVLHGIYSWVDRKNQEIIREFLRQKLKVGGAVYISYNTMPGWTAISPLQKLMFEYGQQSPEPTIKRIDKTVKFIEKFHKTAPLFLQANPILESKIQDILKRKNYDSNYLVHEYFSHHWQPLYFFEVARDMAEAKLTFATSAVVGDNYVNRRFTKEQKELLQEIETSELRETLGDYYTNCGFRKDIFVRGARKLSGLEQKEILSKFRFVTIKASMEDIEYDIEKPGGNIKLEKEIFEPLLSALDGQALTVEELLAKPLIKEKLQNFTNAIDVLTLLIAVGYVKPFLPIKNPTSRQSSIEKFNSVVLERSRYGGELPSLISPLINNGVAVGRITQLFLLAYKRQVDPIDFIYDVLATGGQKLAKDNKLLETEAENKAEIETRWHEFKTHRLPIYQKLKIV